MEKLHTASKKLILDYYITVLSNRIDNSENKYVFIGCSIEERYS